MYSIRHICSDFAKVAYFLKDFDFSRAETFLIRLRFFCLGKYLRSRRAPSAKAKTLKVKKPWKLYRIYKIMFNVRHICSDFAKVDYFPEVFDFSRAETFLIRLRFFVQEKYLRSRRAPSATAKTLKVGKPWKLNWKVSDNVQYKTYM